MTRLTIEQGTDSPFEAGTTQDRLVIHTGIDNREDPGRGIVAPPGAFTVAATRWIGDGDGDPVFLRAAAASRGWSLLECDAADHARARVVFDRPQGNGLVDVLRYDIDGLRIRSWSLHWEGAGANGQHGGVFRESLQFEGTRGQVTVIPTGNAEAFQLAQDDAVAAQ